MCTVGQQQQQQRVASIMATLVAVIRQPRKFHPSFPIASVGQTSMARCAAAISSGVSGCLEKCTAVSSRSYVKRFGASSRQRRHNAQLVSTYHGPGTFSGCLLRLSAIFLTNAWLTAKKITSNLVPHLDGMSRVVLDAEGDFSQTRKR